MTKETKKKLSQFLGNSGIGGEDETISQFIEILSLPNQQFSLIYDEMMRKIDTIFSGRKIQQELLSQLESLPISSEDDIDSIKAEIQEFLNDIAEDETLSEKKKNMITTLINKTVVKIYELAENPREVIEVKIQTINPNAKLPVYAHPSDAGADVFAVEDITIPPHTTQLIKTGFKVAIPYGYEIQVRPRSGLSLKTGLRVANAPGTIDPSYRGEVAVIMENTSNLSATINKGDKIAQLVISPIPMIKWIEVGSLDETERGEGGFGSTDKA